MKEPKTTNWIEYGLIACLIVVAVVGMLAIFSPDIYRTFEEVRSSP